MRVLGFLVFISLFGCKASTPSAPSRTPIKAGLAAAPKDVVKPPENPNGQNPMPKNLDDARNALIAAVEAYKKTDAYKNPKTDREKTAKIEADQVSKMTTEDLQKLVDSGAFSTYQRNIEELPKLEPQGSGTETDTDLGTESHTDIDTALDTDTAGSDVTVTADTAPESGGGGRTAAVNNTGITLIVLSVAMIAIGAVATGARRYGNPGTRGKLSATLLGGLVGGVVGAIPAAIPLILGAVICSTDLPNQDSVKAVQAFLGIGAIVGAGIGVIGTILIATKEIKIPEAVHTASSRPKKVVEWVKGNKYSLAAGAGTLLSVAAAIGMSVAASQIGLADGTQAPPPMGTYERMVYESDRLYTTAYNLENNIPLGH